MMNKLRVAVFFGGASPEHEVSMQSARNVVEALDKEKYEVLLVGLDRKGHWFLENSTQALLNPSVIEVVGEGHEPVLLCSDGSKQLTSLNHSKKNFSFDVAFPVMHGPNGEDGTIQGLFRLAQVPFVGAGILSSALCMDKDYMKRILQQAGLPIPHFVTIYKRDLLTVDYSSLLQEVGLPCFVKPANMGSSVGVSKVHSKEELQDAIELAFRYDTKILVETAIEGREIECSVLGNDSPVASLPGEIILNHEFYTYEAKYIDAHGAVLEAPAKLEPSQVKAVQTLSIQAFQALECEGMARVDLFLTKEGKVLINELNTIPGFTNISMYPRMWEASGLSYSKLLDRLIQLALEAFDKRQSLEILK